MNFDKGRIRAILGPTNTGKTYLAIERMLGYASGMIGFPLRLLARENYDRVVALKGSLSVALITGEEKIIPPNPRWYICTVEAMPTEKFVDFLAVDEIQLCSDPDRGHVFTERLLYARGLYETMFLGADSIESILRHVVQDVEIETRPRFSTLRYQGRQKLTRLPRRTAVVAFSVNEVYSLAETIRRQRGGTAVVLGGLSPQTRNAQIEMYQAGDVDYLVATDAIGMGLNMDVDNVAFAARRKFDGHRTRLLENHEIGQIAGRAGRHMNDGGFGICNNLPDFEPEVIEAVENHKYPPITHIQWRNNRLDFRTPKMLLKSLQHIPADQCMIRAREAEDHITLKILMREAAVMDRAGTVDSVRLLWDICQIPDFRKVMPDHHAELLGRLFLYLSDDGRLPEDWVRAQIDQLDRTDGEIDMLTRRLAYVRTWSYIAHRGAWLEDNFYWQARTRQIEEKLSDSLHISLMQRFVDKRAARLSRRRGKDGEILLSAIRTNGDVVVEGHVTGRMRGLCFEAQDASSIREARELAAATAAVIQREAADRAWQILKSPDQEIRLSPAGNLVWKEAAVAGLARGRTYLSPRVRLRRNNLMDGSLAEKLRLYLQGWLSRYITRTLKPLVVMPGEESGAALKGLLFQLGEKMGAIPRSEIRSRIAVFDHTDRRILAAYGVRFGTEWVFIDKILTPRALRLKSILWACYHQQPVVVFPARSKPVFPADFIDHAAWPLLGYRLCGDLAMRFDRYESFIARLRKISRQSMITCSPDLARLAGCDVTDLAKILLACGCRKVKGSAPLAFRLKRINHFGHSGHPGAVAGRKDRKPARKSKSLEKGKKGKMESDNPFAVLRELVFK